MVAISDLLDQWRYQIGIAIVGDNLASTESFSIELFLVWVYLKIILPDLVSISPFS
jgi:hypothetical protein